MTSTTAESSPVPAAPEANLEPQGLSELQESFRDDINYHWNRLGLTASTLKHGLKVLAIPAAATFTFGAIEGGLMSHWDPKFMALYGLNKLSSGPIWVRDNIQAIAGLAGSPDVVRDFSAEVASRVITRTQADALTVLSDKFYQISSIIAGGTIFGYITNSVMAVRDAGLQIQTAVTEGRARLWKRGEQVFFLGGQQSSVLDARMSQKNRHTVPILESAEGAQNILAKFSRDGKIPTYLLVAGDYARSDAWNNLDFQKKWLIKTKTGDKLIVVGDGSVHEQALDLGAESLLDVELVELEKAATALQNSASKKGIEIESDDVVKIYIANANRESLSGGQHSLTLRERAKREHLVNIFIDSRAPLIERMQKWLGEDTDVVFDTSNTAYFDTVKSLLQERGITVHDKDEENLPKTMKRLVHEDLSSTTIKRAENLRAIDGVAVSNIMTLSDTEEAHYQALDGEFIDLCSVLVYNEEIDSVVAQLRNGKTVDEIQTTFDERWGYPGLDVTKVAQAEM